MAEGVEKNNANVINWPRNHWKLVVMFMLILIVIASAILIYSKHHNKESNVTQASLDIKLANQAYLNGNKTQALEYSREALAAEPNNQIAIGFVATLTQNRAESQQLYKQLLNDYMKTPGAKDPTPVTYWSEANLSEKAGDTNQAEKYYQEAITVSSNYPSNSYYKTVAQRAQTALKEIQ